METLSLFSLIDSQIDDIFNDRHNTRKGRKVKHIRPIPVDTLMRIRPIRTTDRYASFEDRDNY